MQPVLLLGLFLLIGAPSYAQAPVTTPAGPQAVRHVLTLTDALQLAELNHPQIQVAAGQVDAASAGVRIAKSYLNPEISFGTMGHQRSIQPGTLPGKLHGFTFSQTIELPQLRNARVAAAELGQQSSRLALAEDRLNVLGYVKQAFFEAMRRRNEIQIARENLQLLEDLFRRIQVQVEVGEAPQLELTRADAETSVARIQAQGAERRYSTALADLHEAMGIPLGDLEPDAPLNAVATLPPLNDLIAEVLAQHPGLAVAESEKKRADANVTLEKKLKVPQPTAWVDVLEQPDVAQYRFGLSIGIPLWNRREGQIAEAEALRRQANSYGDYRRLQLTTAVERAYGEYRVAQSQVEMFERGIIVQAESAVRGAEAAFQFGERGVLEVLDAQRVLRSTRLEYSNAQFDRQQALIVLEQLRALNLTGANP